jgi:hypothetical protein
VSRLGFVSIHGDDHPGGAEREHQSLARGSQVENHVVGVLQPEMPIALPADGIALPHFAVGAGEIRDVLEIVDLAHGAQVRDAVAADAESADLEVVAPTAEVELPPPICPLKMKASCVSSMVTVPDGSFASPVSGTADPSSATPVVSKRRRRVMVRAILLSLRVVLSYPTVCAQSRTH